MGICSSTVEIRDVVVVVICNSKELEQETSREVEEICSNKLGVVSMLVVEVIYSSKWVVGTSLEVVEICNSKELEMETF